MFLCVLQSRLQSIDWVIKIIILINSRWVKYYIINEENIIYRVPIEAEMIRDTLRDFTHSSLNPLMI